MNVRPHSFEDLWIWQEARLLVAAIYSDFGPDSPGARDYTFKGQIQGCGISIMNNIAEGFEREPVADYARFLDIAKGSCGEVRSMYYVAEDVRCVTPEIAMQRRAMALNIAEGLSSLTQKLREPHKSL